VTRYVDHLADAWTECWSTDDDAPAFARIYAREVIWWDVARGRGAECAGHDGLTRARVQVRDDAPRVRVFVERIVAGDPWVAVEFVAVAPESGGRVGMPGCAWWRLDDDGRITHHGVDHGKLCWPTDRPQLGRHNRLNALAAITAARHAGVAIETAIGALAEFRGIKRRLEIAGIERGVTVYDDFAHHPTAIATTIGGLRREVGRARIIAVLEPRTNTMKVGAMKNALPGSLAEADRVFCYARNLGWDVAGALAPLGAKASVHDDIDALAGAIVTEARSGDHVLVMSNGGFGGIHGKLLARLRG